MPLMSSSVSVGRPIMKYSLQRRHPALNAASNAPNRSSSVTFLLMTSRRRCVPASGATVRPPFFWPATSSAMSTPHESRRCEGTEMRTPFPSQARLMRVRIEAICEWSVDDNDVRLTSS